ncbi:MAG: hypothetical protein IH577_03535 [Deltaproteobacteria bacterium]|nr:hypothetical protein [Deltaproteobacteria bacterium]
MYIEKDATFTANGALGARVRVKLTAGSATDPPQVEIAGAGEQHIGYTKVAVASGGLVAVEGRTGSFVKEVVAAEAFAVGATLYGGANGKVQDTSSGSAIGEAVEAAGGDGEIVRMIDFGVLSTTAATVSVADTGTFTDAATVEAALAEIYQGMLTAKGIIDIPMPVISSAGVALAAFVSADSVTGGYCVTAKGMGIRWNNHATPGPAVASKVMVPPDMDVAANATLHILAAKTGATIGDATKFTIGAFNNVVGAAYDADNTFGGDTDAMVGDETAKNVQHLTRTLALADLEAYPAAIELTLKPKDGTLGTDDVILLAAWIEYKKKVLTA